MAILQMIIGDPGGVATEDQTMSDPHIYADQTKFGPVQFHRVVSDYHLQDSHAYLAYKTIVSSLLIIIRHVVPVIEPFKAFWNVRFFS